MSAPRRRSIEIDGLGHKSPIPAASRIGGFVATGNIYGRDPGTREIPEDPEEQVRLMFANLRAVLAAAGAGLENVLKLEFAVQSLSLRPAINREWLIAFPDPASRPARSVAEYAPFTAPAVVHCDALAVVDDRTA
jgi:enamine deaminase RidA (YjgF/YER057c/UK114 family)